MKRLSKVLSRWSKQQIGDIQEQVHEWEAKIEILQELDIMNNTEQGREDLNKGYEEYTRWLNIQDSMPKQKTSMVQIRNHKGRWVQGDDKVVKVLSSITGNTST